jgi:hypothetical protein
VVLGIKLVKQACYAIIDQRKVVPLPDFLIATLTSEDAMAEKNLPK